MNPYGTVRLYGEPPGPLGGEELSWLDRGLCAETDPEAFFPEKGGSTREAKRVCRSCEVRYECLKYALEHGINFGIWGGMSERERRRLKRQPGTLADLAAATDLPPQGRPAAAPDPQSAKEAA
jgi:WhiB family redox-sensing transcriptional regulator